MLIQVTTKHGKPFRRGGHNFGPQPMRLWVGEDKPPDRRIPVISEATFKLIEQSSGKSGPLLIELDAPHLRSADTEAELAALAAERDDLQRQLANEQERGDRLETESDALAASLTSAQDRIAALEAEHAKTVAALTTLEQEYAKALATLEEEPAADARTGRQNRKR